ncbi:MAG: hypothetical protein ABF856_16150 [Acetobacter aceti]|uniref:Uncharacterized protein n=1 Tax=Acetobacter aceti TaxID=435 RepID=A0A1U9KJD7_ACEAC|nr:hypothetical protein [Acetobacter aceti]AQS85839.1 hypothetical protein A0U92_14860 [Acetobacter aceti]
MSDFSYIRRFEHPYASNGTHAHFRRTTYTHSPFSAAAVPFGWMMRGNEDLPDQAARLSLGYRSELEPDVGFDSIWVQDRRNQLVMLDTFFGAIEPETSPYSIASISPRFGPGVSTTFSISARSASVPSNCW